MTVGLDYRGWLAAALGNAPLSAMDALQEAQLLRAAEEEGVLPLLEWRLREGGDLSMGTSTSFDGALRERARQYAVIAMMRDALLGRMADVLCKADLRTLLLKGPAFARWLYPERHLRVSGDIDLLFASRDEADRAADVLKELGYELAFVPTAMTYEMTARHVGDGLPKPEIDLHCRLANVPAFADRFAFEELWRSSIALNGLNPWMRGLGLPEAFLHACIHRAVDAGLHRPNRLKWLYDIHLMMIRQQGDDWLPVLELSIAKRLAGVCLRSIEDAIACFASEVPEDVLLRLRTAAGLEPLDYRRLDDWRYMQGQNFRALPTASARLRWLWERLLPTASHLRELHGEGGGARLMWRRIHRGFLRLRDKG